MCFYSHAPFWADEELPLDIVYTPAEFAERMGAFVLDDYRDGLHLRVARDGEIQIQRRDLEERIAANAEQRDLGVNVQIWAEYVKTLNVFYLALDMASIAQNLAFLRFQEITRQDAYRVVYKEGRFSSSSIQTDSISSYYQMGRYLTMYPANVPIRADFRMFHRRVAPRAMLVQAVQFLRTFASDADLLDKIDVLSKALGQYKLGNLSNSIVLSWFVLERCINEIYEAYVGSKAEVVAGVQRMPADRKRFLTGRDFTAAIKTNMLELAGLITLAEKNQFDVVRGHRNDVAHNLRRQTITSQHCRDALSFAASFVLKAKIENPQLNLSQTLSMF